MREKTIGFELKNLSNLIKRRMNENGGRPGGITGIQGWVIGYLYDNGDKREIFQRDLEKEFQVRRSTITGILQSMEKNGLIIREPVGFDARLKRLKLTEKAVGIHQEVNEKIKSMESRLRRGVSDEEVEAFFNTIEKFKKNIE